MLSIVFIYVGFVLLDLYGCTFVLMSLCWWCSLIDIFVNGRIVGGIIVLVSLSCIWGGLQLQFLDKICVYNRGNIV